MNYPYTTTPAQRQAARERRAAKEAGSAAARRDSIAIRVEDWKLENPAAWAWIEANAPENRFAQSMANALYQWGSLTERQMEAVTRALMEPVRGPAPVVDLMAVETAFATAKGQGIKFPKLTLGRFSLKPASANSSNPGAIYVTQGRGESGTYLGKVMGGKFLRVRSCDDDTEKAVLEAIKDPKAAAIAYGKKYGQCAVCMRDLTDPESIERGIGPICADRMGW